MRNTVSGTSGYTVNVVPIATNANTIMMLNTPDITISLGNSTVFGTPQYAMELHVEPGSPHTIAVARSN